MKQIFVTDIKPGVNLSDVPLGLSELKKAEDKNGNPYWNVTLIDNTGEIQGKVWNETVARLINLNPQPGNVYSISGSVSEFRGSAQVTVADMKLVDEKDIELGDFIAATDKPLKQLKTEVNHFVKQIKDKDLNNLILDFLKIHSDKFFMWPAAKRNHHQFRGGLAEHVIEMLTIAEATLKFYPEANKSLVYTGIILHDSGKMIELEMDGFVTEYGMKGNLLGHIVMGVGIIDEIVHSDPKKYAKFIKSDKLVLLKHIILSHHSKLEFGSPVQPKTIEAGIVARVDVLSGDTRSFQRILSKHGGDESDYSPSEFTLDNVKVYLRSENAFDTETVDDEAEDLGTQPSLV